MTDSFMGEPRFLFLTMVDMGFWAMGICRSVFTEVLSRCAELLAPILDVLVLKAPPAVAEDAAKEAAKELPKLAVITEELPPPPLLLPPVTIGDLRISNSNGSVSLNS